MIFISLEAALVRLVETIPSPVDIAPFRMLAEDAWMSTARMMDFGK